MQSLMFSLLTLHMEKYPLYQQNLEATSVCDKTAIMAGSILYNIILDS